MRLGGPCERRGPPPARTYPPTLWPGRLRRPSPRALACRMTNCPTDSGATKATIEEPSCDTPAIPLHACARATVPRRTLLGDGTRGPRRPRRAKEYGMEKPTPNRPRQGRQRCTWDSEILGTAQHAPGARAAPTAPSYRDRRRRSLERTIAAGATQRTERERRQCGDAHLLAVTTKEQERRSFPEG